MPFDFQSEAMLHASAALLRLLLLRLTPEERKKLATSAKAAIHDSLTEQRTKSAAKDLIDELTK